MTMTTPETADATWTAWNVSRNSAFEVYDAKGEVKLVQIDQERFLVLTPFRFSDPVLEQSLVERLCRSGLGQEQARRAVDDARTFTPSSENPTDLASIPQFVRWFENSYGRHTLAAILHDNLIVAKANEGALRSDTLSDRFFRDMLRSVEVPFFKRWIIWAAVAVRSRWAASGLQRASLTVWFLMALAGISAFVSAAGTYLFGWPRVADGGALLLVAVTLPFASGVLWGRQYGASLVAAASCLWLLPAALLALLAVFSYRVLELLARAVGLR